jgi:phenylacetate-CoA ligase
MRLPRVVSYHASTLTEARRRLIEDDLGIPVVSTYGAVETFGIGFTCEERTEFHLHEDLCHLRVVAEDGADAPAGERGEVVVSNLVNRAMVLLNYRLGDIAALRKGRCTCGRTFRLLAGLEGRVSEIVHLRSGALVHPGSVAGVLFVDGLLRFQLLQEARDRFRLEVVTSDDDSYRRVADRALPELRSLLEGAGVELVRRGSIDGSGDRKLRRVVALPAGRGR